MKHALSILALSIAVGCTTHPATEAKINILNPEVESAWRDVTKALRMTRSPLRFQSGATVNDCQRYLEQRVHSQVDEGVNNRGIQREYLVCDTLAWLKGANKTDARSPAEGYGNQLRDRLDLTSFPSSLHQLAQDQPTLADLQAMPVHTDARSAVAESDDWLFRLEVVAVADVNHDGAPDWIVWLTDEARDGNYRDYSVLLVPDTTGQGPLHAQAVTIPTTTSGR